MFPIFVCSEPLPVSNLIVKHFDSDTIKLTWDPPTEGYFKAFKIYVTDESRLTVAFIRSVLFFLSKISDVITWHVKDFSDIDTCTCYYFLTHVLRYMLLFYH